MVFSRSGLRRDCRVAGIDLGSARQLNLVVPGDMDLCSTDPFLVLILGADYVREVFFRSDSCDIDKQACLDINPPRIDDVQIVQI